MTQIEKIEAYFAKERPFREGLSLLRKLAKQTEALETLKWGSPVYTVLDKNIFGIMGFKNHFGIWFFQGVYMKDPKGVLESAQEKTKAMRHWKFRSHSAVDAEAVLAYMNEAIENQKKGLEYRPARSKKLVIPALLAAAMEKDDALKAAFDSLTPYKQREYCEHIGSAKQEKTRNSRLEKSIPLIRRGLSMNDIYR